MQTNRAEAMFELVNAADERVRKYFDKSLSPKALRECEAVILHCAEEIAFELEDGGMADTYWPDVVVASGEPDEGDQFVGSLHVLVFGFGDVRALCNELLDQVDAFTTWADFKTWCEGRFTRQPADELLADGSGFDYRAWLLDWLVTPAGKERGEVKKDYKVVAGTT